MLLSSSLGAFLSVLPSSYSGGLQGLMTRSKNNLAAVTAAVDKLPWLNFLAENAETRSCTSVCLTVDMEATKLKKMIAWLEAEDIAYDIGAYRDAPDGLRVWCGPPSTPRTWSCSCSGWSTLTKSSTPRHEGRTPLHGDMKRSWRVCP